MCCGSLVVPCDHGLGSVGAASVYGGVVVGGCCAVSDAIANTCGSQTQNAALHSARTVTLFLMKSSWSASDTLMFTPSLNNRLAPCASPTIGAFGGTSLFSTMFRPQI